MSAAALLLAVVAALGWYEARRWKAFAASQVDLAARNGTLLDAAQAEASRLRGLLEPRMEESFMRAHILRSWPRDKTERFALHLLGDDAQARWDALHTVTPGHGTPARAWLDEALAGETP